MNADVWVVRDADGRVVGIGSAREDAIADADFSGYHEADQELRSGSNGPCCGFTVMRSPILPAEDGALVAAAVALDEARDVRAEWTGKHFPKARLSDHIAVMDAQVVYDLALLAYRQVAS